MNIMEINTPVNTREIPCDGCGNHKECTNNSTECVAVRKWYVSGKFMDKDVGRLIRVAR